MSADTGARERAIQKVRKVAGAGFAPQMLFRNEARELLAALAAGVGVPPDKDLGCAPARERQDARAGDAGCAQPQSAERADAVNAKDNPSATGDGATGDLTDRQPRYRDKTLAQLVGDAHQVILNAPREKDAADKEAMRLLQIAYARLEGVR